MKQKYEGFFEVLVTFEAKLLFEKIVVLLGVFCHG
jgi:hypothetical protein